MDRLSKTKSLWNSVQAEPGLDKKICLGPINSHSLALDPKHLGFTLSRYKFAAKMLHDRKKTVDVGCGEGIGCLMLNSETAAEVIGVDFDPVQIDYAETHIRPVCQIEFRCVDLIEDRLEIQNVDGLVSLDVIEHIHPEEQDRFLANVISCLTPDSVAVFGTPSVYSHEHTSERSRIGHINLFDEKRLRDTFLEYFRHVFVFSMNDEMVHTGFPKMAHYFMALCCGKIDRGE